MKPFLSESAISETSIPLCMSGDDLELLAAGDPRFGDFVPDDYKAYIRGRICTAFPKVIGPEMHGDYFGFHPQVLANSYRSLIHQQANIGHALKANGATRDRIIGSVVWAGIGNMQRQTVQKMADSVETAQYIEFVAVVHKRAEGVTAMIGKHMTAREKTSVSIELFPKLSNISVYNPIDRTIHPVKEASELWPELITVRKKDKRILLGRVDGKQFAWAPGGESGNVSFAGFGFTPNPAEGDTARIIDLAAQTADGDEVMSLAAMAVMDWKPGMDVKWPRLLAGDAGRGRVEDVILAGSVTSHGKTKVAAPGDPLLEIAVAGKSLRVIRHASSVAAL